MIGVTAPVLLAHLIGQRWYIKDLLLYGGATLGMIHGIGLFRWGRDECYQNRKDIVITATLRR